MIKFIPDRSEILESLLSINMAGQKTEYVPKFCQIVEALNLRGIDYAITGSLALGVFTEPRFTNEIKILLNPNAVTEASAFLSASGVSINTYPALLIPEQLAVTHPLKVDIFNISVNFINPEYMLCLYLDGRTMADRANAFSLIESGYVTEESFSNLLTQQGELNILEKFQRLREQFNVPRLSYSDSVKIRLSRKRARPKI